MMLDFSWWLDVKRQLVDLTSLERDAWHIYLGVTIQLATAAILRWRLAEWRTLLPLIVLELANEAADLGYEVWVPAQRSMQWWASGHDVLNTLVMPIVVLVIARRLAR